MGEGSEGGASALAGTPAAAAGSPYLDFGARLYDPRTAAWLSLDPMAEKYYPISPYAYCAGSPVNLVDIRGLEVLPRSAIELEIIRNTLPEDARLFVQLNENGLIDKELLSQYPSLSVIGAAEAFSHEGYGHALLYVRNGYDHNGASHQPVGMRDTNTILVKMILKARQETVKNVQP